MASLSAILKNYFSLVLLTARSADSKLCRKHLGDFVDKTELKSFRLEIQDGAMVAVLEVHFALLLLNRKSCLSGNQVSYTGAFWPFVFSTTAGAMYRVAVFKRSPVFQHNTVFIHAFIFLGNIGTITLPWKKVFCVTRS